MNNSKIFFPLQIVMFLHLTDLIGIGVEAKVWNPSEKVCSFISNGKPNPLNLQLPHTWKNVHEPLHSMFSCAHSQRSSLKNNTVSLVHSEALLLCNHLDVPGVSDSKKCLLAAWKGGSASSFADSRKCSSSASLKQNENFSFMYLSSLQMHALGRTYSNKHLMRHE